jgi:hypothetical protein
MAQGTLSRSSLFDGSHIHHFLYHLFSLILADLANHDTNDNSLFAQYNPHLAQQNHTSIQNYIHEPINFSFHLCFQNTQ